jgi:glycosyltransferase involved in cell wall biosynthesis
MSFPTIAICMATYNGEKFISEQLESILNQSCNNWILFIHDDNSTDRTVDVIEQYVKKNTGKIVFLNDDVEFKRPELNFVYILEKIPEYDYYMFCDQDDVWMENKIQITLDCLKKVEQKFGRTHPALVHTDLKVTDASLGVISESFWKYKHVSPEIADSLDGLFLQNVVTGCTVMINLALKKKTKFPKDGAMLMNDWWLAMTAAAFGKVEHVDAQTICYRQHKNNVVGARLLSVKNLERLIRYKKHVISVKAQAEAFLKIYAEELDKTKVARMLLYVSLFGRNIFFRKYTVLKKFMLRRGLLRNILLLCFI